MVKLTKKQRKKIDLYNYNRADFDDEDIEREKLIRKNLKKKNK